ncbi:penicillin-binding protein activator [Thermithiobacillus plumbiphilus]|uniref:Penicillin-binding protein activator n=1 Tax=Thermithiobacillus plumbiphilus TaxID=1729899 RepID=A0ABU9D6G6_9PROT
MITKTSAPRPQQAAKYRGILLFLLMLALLLAEGGQAVAETPAASATVTTPAAGPGARVCVLLPVTGRYAGLATAIRLGIEGAARQQSAIDQAPVQVYDTQGQPASAVAAYDLARAQACPAIIGPLLRAEALSVLRVRKAGDPPILPLAPVNADASKGVHPFGLTPEPEARQLATDLREQGYLRAALLHTSGDIDRRMHAAFLQQWSGLGGRITVDQLLPPGEGEVLPTIQRMLEKAGVSGAKSGDTDAIILFVPGNLARALTPILRQQVGTLPIFGSSRLNTGGPQTAGSDTPEGLTFLDMPWMLSPEASWMPLRQELLRQMPNANEVSWRLSALGFDSYQLAQHLANGNQAVPFLGATGILRIMPDGTVQRRLSWGRYEQGQLRVYAMPPGKNP